MVFSAPKRGWARGLAALALLWLIPIGAAATASGAPVPPQKASASKSQSADEKRARWEKLSDKEKKELKKRFERLKGMSDEERARLSSRAEKLAKEMAEIEASLGDDERAALKALKPRERRKVLRDLVSDRAKVAASRLRMRMTPAERQRVEGAPPEERAEILRGIRERELARLPDRIAQLGEELGLSQAELRQVRAGSRREQRKAIVGIVRKHADKQVAEQGLPEPLGAKRWAETCAMGDDAFLRALRRIHRRAPEFGIPKKRWEHRMKRREGLAKKLEALATPNDRDRAGAPELAEKALRRRVLLARRDRAEELMIHRAHLRRDMAAKIRTLSDQDFPAAHRFMIKTLREGAGVNGALERWFQRQGDGSNRRSGDRQGKRQDGRLGAPKDGRKSERSRRKRR